MIMKLSSIFNRGNSRSSALQSGAIGAAPLSSSVRPLVLEQRFMFDGAAVDAAADAAQASLTEVAARSAQQVTMLWVPPAMEVRAASPQLLESKKEVVLLDASLANYHTLKAGVPEGMGIVVFDGAADGLAQIAAWAAGQSGLDAIHLFSHGNDGQLHLGSATLTAVSLSHAQVQEQLATLGRALQADGDLLLYGCDVAQTPEGQDFIRHLALLTGADIAASSDATGAALKGGDWDLEYRHGMIEATALTASAYQGVLSQATFTFDNAVLEQGGLVAKQELGNHTLVMTAQNASFLLPTEVELGVGVDTAADGMLLLVDPDGEDVITLKLNGGKSFDLTSFALVDTSILNQGLKLTTSKGAE
ncbi:MAG: DUF4347 domain-containing protein, partial [Comamonas sp.]|nr:DUF4347 domain-containing protein [Candidatus Comamonas equi]